MCHQHFFYKQCVAVWKRLRNNVPEQCFWVADHKWKKFILLTKKIPEIFFELVLRKKAMFNQILLDWAKKLLCLVKGFWQTIKRSADRYLGNHVLANDWCAKLIVVSFSSINFTQQMYCINCFVHRSLQRNV